jgi:hypothetical protein
MPWRGWPARNFLRLLLSTFGLSFLLHYLEFFALLVP